jgi:hypothetical protein
MCQHFVRIHYGPSEIRQKLLFHRPDEISATEISPRLNRRRIYKRAHLTVQVGQAPVKSATLVSAKI